MKIVKAAVVLLMEMLLVSAFACGGGSGQVSNPTPTSIPTHPLGWSTYSNNYLGIRIQYPEDWTEAEGLVGTVVAFSPPESSAGFADNLNIVVQDISSQPMTLSEYVELTLNMSSQYFSDYNLIESSTTTLSSEPAQKVVFTAKQGQYALKWMAVISIKNNVAYEITYTATASSYSSNLDTIQQMINSFSFY